MPYIRFGGRFREFGKSVALAGLLHWRRKEETKPFKYAMMKELLIKHLAAGKTQGEISEILKKKKIKPSSVSSVEKYLKAMRIEYRAKTAFHLAVILCRNGEIE